MDADSRLHILKNTFSSILNNRKDLLNTFIQQQVKIQLLKNNYAEYVKNNNSTLLVFGLDTFHFQSKLLDMEYDELNKFFLIINNRIYCEYFKLYKIIIEYLNKNIKEPKLLDMTKTINRFPVYKDLEPYKQYDIQIISDIHEQIILLLTGFDIFITNKEDVLKTHIQKKNIGFNLDNFVNTYNYDITIIREKLSLFLDYIDFFHKIHSKYLNTFAEKLNLMITELNRDIHPDTITDDHVISEIMPVVEEEPVVEEAVVEEEPVVEEVVEEPVVEEVVEEAVVEEEAVIEEPVVEEPVVEEAVEEPLVEEEPVVEEVVEEAVIEESVIEEHIVERLVVEDSLDQNKDTIIEQLMKEAIIDYKENNNLLTEEITTIKKAIHNLKLTVIVEEVADEISIETIEEPDFHQEVQVEENQLIDSIVIEEPVVEEPSVVIEEPVVVEEPVVEEPPIVIDEPVVEELVVEEDPSVLVIEEPVVINEPTVEELPIVIEETVVVEEPVGDVIVQEEVVIDEKSN
jgi:hypothetical protein